MNLTPIKNVVTSNASRQILIGRKYSPQILFVGGIVGVTTATVLACRATLRFEDEVLIPAEKKMLNVQTRRQEKAVRLRMVLDTGRLYAPSVILGVASVSALAGSHTILVRRNAALTATVALLDQALKDYRQRVVEDLGAEQDAKYAYGLEDHEVIAGYDKNGREKIETVKVVTSGANSPYAKFFDNSCEAWEPSREDNYNFLRIQQEYFTNRLHAKGHIFLNEVYDALGIERTEAGNVVGWVKSKDRSTDNYIDFGIFDAGNEQARAYMHGVEKALLLDFNVDGPIMNLIGWTKT